MARSRESASRRSSSIAARTVSTAVTAKPTLSEVESVTPVAAAEVEHGTAEEVVDVVNEKPVGLVAPRVLRLCVGRLQPVAGSVRSLRQRMPLAQVVR